MNPGDVISHLQMSQEEGRHLQQGMSYSLKDKPYSVILMSVRKGAPYADRVEENGKVLIYEGHDIPNYKGGEDPKTIDQPRFHAGGSPTQNGHFCAAVDRFKKNPADIRKVRVYEKIKMGIWVYSGLFLLEDYWQEKSNGRKVFKFRLEMSDADTNFEETPDTIEHNRIIPTEVKLEVWKRDKGKCTMCGSGDNLHFDHILPYAKGGTSLKKENIQLLCVRHNLEKRDKIQ